MLFTRPLQGNAVNLELVIYQCTQKFTRAWARMGSDVATPLILSELTVTITNPVCK